MAKNDSYRDGRKSGHKFIERARKHPIAHSIDPFYNPKPHRPRDREFNDGVRKGIREKESKCFLSSACAVGLGLPDDCQELETLRRFRDDHLLSTPQGSDELRRYYEIAPRIVEGIEATGRARDIYEQIYRLLVSPCVSLIADGRPEEAKILYRSVTEDLSVTFAPGR